MEFKKDSIILNSKSPEPVPENGDITMQNRQEPDSFSEKDRIYAMLCFVLGFLFFRYIVYAPVFGLHSTLVIVCLLAVCAAYMKYKGKTQTKRDKAIAAIVLLYAVLLALTDNNVIKLFAFLFCLLCGAYWVYSVFTSQKQVDDYLGFDLGAALVKQPFGSFGKIWKALFCGKKHQSISLIYICIGLLLAIPLSIFVALQLISADAFMEKMLSDMLSGISNGLGIFLWQWILGVLVASYLFGMLHSYSRKERESKLSDAMYEERLAKRRLIPNMVLYTVVVPIMMLYVLFSVRRFDILCRLSKAHCPKVLAIRNMHAAVFLNCAGSRFLILG